MFEVSYQENNQETFANITLALTAAQTALDSGVTSQVVITVGTYRLVCTKN